MRSSFPLVGLVLLLAVPGLAHAEPNELRVDLRVDLPIVVGLGGAWIGTEIAKPQLAPETCRWCDVPGIDVAARDAFLWEDPHGAGVASNVVGFVGIPLSLLALDYGLSRAAGGNLEDWGTDSLILTEALVVSSALTQITKYSVGRQRPFVHARAPGTGEADADDNVSFFSGHTSMAFSLASAAGTVALLRGYPHSWAVWTLGLTAAITVGWLRIAADKHYLTDVLVGAAVGGSVGVLIPYLHRGTAGARGATSASVVPAGLAFTFVF